MIDNDLTLGPKSIFLPSLIQYGIERFDLKSNSRSSIYIL